MFEWRGSSEPARPYRLRMHYGSATHEVFDPYQFTPRISAQDLHLFGEGKLQQGYRMLGSHGIEIDGIQGLDPSVAIVDELGFQQFAQHILVLRAE